ncbi:hypothetical protein NHQ30_001483 [Ciborinia camelliae]|nr:hypothetical protein NHQ30_001483 [Ciborinia camelliae]
MTGDREPVAVIGFAVKFPEHATSVERFWQMLVEGRCASSKIPKDRMNADAFRGSSGDSYDTFSAQRGHFLQDDIAAFDAPFFSISPAEAATMDPQQRVLLETAYHALENAGIPLDKISGSRTSVFTGCFTDDYKMMFASDPEQFSQYGMTGVSASILANRLSWFFNLLGTSTSVDAACASSLLGIDLACQSLLSGDSAMSLVAGCNLILSPATTLLLDNQNLLSKHGRSYSFDDRADGYARGEGFSVIVLKRLSDALRDGDTIRAVIRSSHTNQNGRTKAGMTRTSQESQESLIKDTYIKAGLDLELTKYIEAHGTGTRLGDAFEANAIGNVFRKSRKDGEPLLVGAVKSNIGHLEGGSGLAGLIKAILVLERGVIPKNVNFENPNPRIDTEILGIKVHPLTAIKFPLELMAWPGDGIRRASINSMGFGGANVHVVIDDAYNFLRTNKLEGKHNTVVKPPTKAEIDCQNKGMNRPEATSSSEKELQSFKKKDPVLLVWSASDKDSVYRIAVAYAQYFKALKVKQGDDDENFLAKLAYTLNVRRTNFPWRTYLIVNSMDDLCLLESRLSTPVLIKPSSPRLGFVFTGQGAQWFGMGRELLRYPVFHQSLLDSAEFLRGMGCEWNLLYKAVLFENGDCDINAPEYSQPLCTAIQIALVDLLSSFKIRPTVVVGHSSGEIAAAYCIGALSRSSAMKVAYFRGVQAALLTKMDSAQGTMMAVKLSPSQILPYFREVEAKHGTLDLTIACYNSENNLTISGHRDQIETLHSLLSEAREQSFKLKVNVAYHSSHMRAISNDYETSIRDLEKGSEEFQQNIPMISSVTGERVSISCLCSSDYWVQNLVLPVKFGKALSIICTPTSTSISRRKKVDGSHNLSFFADNLIEVGPHAALRGPASDIISHCSEKPQTKYMSLLLRNFSAVETVLGVVGDLHCEGYPVDLGQVNRDDCQSPNVKSLIDLPVYPFDHSQKYWFESRISKGIRFGANPKNKLLGKAVADWNPLDARWRNFIKVSDPPWVEDHKVQGTVVYPAAGMLVMALEAAKQLGDQSRPVKMFLIEQAKFEAPLIIHPISRLEVQVALRPLQYNASSLDSENLKLFEFKIFSIPEDNKKWMQNASGTVGIRYEDSESDATDKGIFSDVSMLQDTTTPLAHDSKMKDKFYKALRDSGYEYGPSFQITKNISHNPRESIGQVEICQVSSDAHIIHPTTLDAIFHLVFASLTNGGAQSMETLLPTEVKRIWIASSGLGYSDNASQSPSLANVTAKYLENFGGHLGPETSICVTDECSGAVLAKVEGLKFQKVTTFATRSDTLASGSTEAASNLCRKLEWKRDISLLSSEAIIKLCESGRPKTSEPINFFRALDRLISLFLRKTMVYVDANNILDMQLPPHIQQYIKWMRKKLESYDHQSLPDTDNEKHDNSIGNGDDEEMLLLSQVACSNDLGKLMVTVGNNICKLITNDLDRLSFFFQTDPNMLPAAYTALNQMSNFMHPLKQYLGHLAHLDPSMKILEIGAGTGATTMSVLESLTSKNGDPLYGQYDFTDLSPAFFEAAREKFEGSKRVNFRVFDVEKDVKDQGYTPGSYDLIIASNVIHATKNLANSLQKARSLLKTGGKLILMELIQPETPRIGFAFGLLEGWWLGVQDSREWSPCISESQWNDLLLQNEFSGNELLFRDFENDDCHQMSLIVSTATDTAQVKPKDDLKFVIVVSSKLIAGSTLATNAKLHFESFGMDIEKIVTFEDLRKAHPIAEHTVYIILVELTCPLLRDISPAEFETLQTLFQSAKGVIWVSDSSSKPNIGMIDGLARVVRGENNKMVLVSVSLETTDGVLSVHQARNLYSIIQRTPWDSMNNEGGYETSFVENDGILEVGRITDDYDSSKLIVEKSLPPKRTVQRFDQAPNLELRVEYTGLLDTIYFAEVERNLQPLAEDEVEIQVRASGIIFKDLLTALGKLVGGNLGWECAGVVVRVGSNCNYQIGQEVCGLAEGSQQSFVRMNRQCMMKIPDGMSFAEGASFPVAFWTAYHSLKSANIQQGESILIHSAAGATGQAAIQVARHFGISEIFATVGTDEKRNLLIDHYGIPEDHIFSSRNVEFAENIKAATKNGVDVILNSLSGKGLLASWECIAPDGRFMEIGKADMISNTGLPMQQFLKNVSFSSFDISQLVRERPHRLAGATQALEKMWQDKTIQLIHPLQKFPVSEAESAFRLLQTGKSSGKIVLEMLPESQVEVIPKMHSKALFDPTKTYLIAGGLGGIGRSIARWMVERGARFLIILSRSGPKTTAAIQLTSELEAEGAVLKTLACDISDRAALKSVLEACMKDLPPIQGCFQAAMVLRDSLFEKMSFESWKEAVDPKVNGSWNLHELLPPSLDFFIMLSSNCGILGQVGQANYAAGNTYQDALARYRISQGQHGISIDLGAIMFGGYVRENQDVAKRLLESGYFKPLSEQDFFGLLEHCCDTSRELTPTDGQVVFGLAQPQNMSSSDIAKESRIAWPLFRSMHTQDTTASIAPKSQYQDAYDFKKRFIEAHTIAEAGAIATEELVKKLSKNLPSMGNVDLWRPLMTYGVDSLLSVELRSWFARDFAADIGIFEVMNGATFTSIGVTVAKNSRISRTAAAFELKFKRLFLIYCPQLENDTLCTGRSSSRVLCAHFVSEFQILIVSSSEHEIISLLSGENEAELTESKWPLILPRGVPFMLQSRIVVSAKQDTSRQPSEENATEFTVSIWPLSVPASTAASGAIFQSLIVVSAEHEASRLLSNVFGLHEDGPLVDIPMKEARVALIKTPVWPQAGPGTIAALEKATRILKSHGIKVEEVPFPEEFNDLGSLKRIHTVLGNSDAQESFLREYRSDRPNEVGSGNSWAGRKRIQLYS